VQIFYDRVVAGEKESQVQVWILTEFNSTNINPCIGKTLGQTTLPDSRSSL
jgi:hypothetical protein